MPTKLDLSGDEMIARVRAQNSVASRRYYRSNKAVVAERRKKMRDEMMSKARAFDAGAVAPAKPAVEAVPSKPKKVFMLQQMDHGEKEVVRKTFDQDGIMKELIRLYASGKIASKKSFENYRSSLNMIFMLLKPGEDLLTAILSPESFVQTIAESRDPRTGEQYAENTLKSRFQTIVYVIDNIIDPPQQQRQLIPESIKNVWKREFGVKKIVSDKVVVAERNANQKLVPWPEMLELVAEHYGEHSKAFLMTSMYQQVPVRDDFQLKIAEAVEQTRDNKTNFIVSPEDPSSNCTVVINHYKTASRYGFGHTYKLSEYVSSLARDYMNKRGLDEGDFLFGKSSQSHFIGSLNDKIKLPPEYPRIGITTFRRMSASQADLETPEQMYDHAQRLLHAVNTQQSKYKGNTKSLKQASITAFVAKANK